MTFRAGDLVRGDVRTIPHVTDIRPVVGVIVSPGDGDKAGSWWVLCEGGVLVEEDESRMTLIQRGEE